MGLARPIIFSCRGARPGRAIKLSKDGPHPARPIKFSRRWARPGPSYFQKMGRDPAQPIEFQILPTQSGSAPPIILEICRPGPAHDIRSEAHETRALNGSARHLCAPARGFKGPAHGPFHVLRRTRKGAPWRLQCSY